MPASEVLILVLSSSFQHCSLQCRSKCLWCYSTNQIAEMIPPESGSQFLIFFLGKECINSAMSTGPPTLERKGSRRPAGSCPVEGGGAAQRKGPPYAKVVSFARV